MTNVEFLTDAKTVNQENFLLQIKDVLETSMTVSPLGNGSSDEYGETTGATIQGFPYAGPLIQFNGINGTAPLNTTEADTFVFGWNQVASPQNANDGTGLVTQNAISFVASPFGVSGSTNVPYSIVQDRNIIM